MSPGMERGAGYGYSGAADGAMNQVAVHPLPAEVRQQHGVGVQTRPRKRSNVRGPTFFAYPLMYHAVLRRGVRDVPGFTARLADERA